MKEVKLELYSVQIPVTTFVLAENEDDAMNQATELWQEQLPGVYLSNNAPCQWTGESEDITVIKDPKIDDFIGNVYLNYMYFYKY